MVTTNMNPKYQDIINSVEMQLDFLARMMLAWNTDNIEIGEREKEGFFYSIECVRKELAQIKT